MMANCKKCNGELLTECDPYGVIPTSQEYQLYCWTCFTVKGCERSLSAKQKQDIRECRPPNRLEIFSEKKLITTARASGKTEARRLLRSNHEDN